MSRLSHELRYAIRMLAKSPAFTFIAILTLALAIGANTAIFSAINALLLNPYPFPESDRVVLLDARHVSGKNSNTGYRDFLDWQAQNTVLENVAIVPWIGTYTLTGLGEPQRLIGGETTADFFRVLGVQPARGRFFSPDEDRPHAPRVALLGYGAWKKYFDEAADTLGRTITLNGEPFTVIGIMPHHFVFPGTPTCDFFTALRESGSGGRFQHQYGVVARVKPGVTLAQAQANMSAIANRLAQEYPDSNTGWGVVVLPVRQALVAEARQPSFILFSVVTFVLLLACANLAGLLLARASARTKEIAIRLSLGAGRVQIVRQLLVESTLLSLAGGAAGLLVANWLMSVLRRAAPENFALDSALRLDPAVLAFTLMISFATGIVFGLAPAWYGSKAGLNVALRGDASAWGGPRSQSRLQSFLVTGQVALSAVLLVVAGLLIRDLFAVLHMNTGLRTEHVLTFGLDLPWAKYSSARRIVARYQDVIAGLNRVPGVERAAAVETLPMTGGMTGGSFQMEGRPKAADWVDTLVQYNFVTPGYFRIIGIPLLQGRDFDERDTETAMPVAVINDTLARQFFPNENPIGHRFRDDYDGQWRTIVGTVGSVKNQQPMKPPIPGLYVPHAQEAQSRMTVVVRTQGDPAKLATAARSIVHATDADLLIVEMRTMDQVVADSMAEPALLTSFVAGFAAFALLLAAIGIYSIMAYSVSQRTHEMGVRMALGAERSDIFRLVLRRGAVLTGLGIALGIPAAFAASQMIGSLLYGIASRDTAVYTAVLLLLISVSLAASYFPARRATKADPAAALRSE